MEQRPEGDIVLNHAIEIAGRKVLRLRRLGTDEAYRDLLFTRKLLAKLCNLDPNKIDAASRTDRMPTIPITARSGGHTVLAPTLHGDTVGVRTLDEETLSTAAVSETLRTEPVDDMPDADAGVLRDDTGVTITVEDDEDDDTES